MKQRINIFWFRRDLRLNDNTGFEHAIQDERPVLPIFIFDTDILESIEDRHDRRVSFIYHTLVGINARLKNIGSGIKVCIDKPLNAFEKLFDMYDVGAVYTNTDYEPYATSRDSAVEKLCLRKGVRYFSFKDQVIFEKGEVLKDDGTPYTVFTPYAKKWKSTYYPSKKRTFNVGRTKSNLHRETFDLPPLRALGFKENHDVFPVPVLDKQLLTRYHLTRDYPALEGTSRMGLHLRFGTISVRDLVDTAISGSEKFLNELIWREFYMQILWHFPHVVSEPFKPKFRHIKWKNNAIHFRRWCNGETGFPIVDAGMRQLNATGWMHNRVRMIVANFFTKILLLDWRLGEAYFAEKLYDYELASNNGNWQWAAGCGCDAQPYFRIFNPMTQATKFDPDQIYIRKWIPEYHPDRYIKPMVNYEAARKDTLALFKDLMSEHPTSKLPSPSNELTVY